VVELVTQHQEAKIVHRPAGNKQTSIKTKVALTTLLSVSLVLICVSGSLFFYFHNLLRESIFKQQFVMVSEIAEQFNGRIQLARHQLSLAATELNSQVLADPAELEQALTHVSAISMIFDAGFLVIGTDGRVIAESMELPDLVGMDLRFRDYVNVPLKSGKPFISAPFRRSLPPHNPMIAMVVPVRDNDDRIICLLAGYHSLGNDQFLTSLSSKGLGSTGYLYLLHGRTIIMHSDNTRILETIAEGKNRGIDQALKGMEGSLDNVNSRGQHVLSSFKRVGETGWILAANIPYDDAFGQLKKLAFNAVLIASAGILFSLLVVWYVIRRVTRPIQQLITHIDGVCNSSAEWKPLELQTGDELERLAHAFNGMMNEIQQADKALKQHAETYRIVAEYTSEIAFWRTLDDSIQFISANCFDITGYRDAEFYARSDLLDELIHPDDRPLWKCHQENQDKPDARSPLQIRILCKDGSSKWMNHSCHLVCDEGGQVTGIRGSFSDITDTVLAQQRLSDEKIFVENLINSALTPIFVINSDHKVLYWNQALEIITGKMAASLKGTDLHWSGLYAARRTTLADLIIDDEKKIAGFYDTYSSSKYISGGFQAEGWFDIDSKQRYMFFEAAPIRNSSGQVIAAIESLEDITERKIVEMELAKSRKELEANHVELEALFKQVERGKKEWEETLDHLRDFVILTDAEHHVRRYNRLLADITGRDITGLVGMEWRDLLTESGFHFENFTGKNGELKHERSGRIYDVSVYEIIHDNLLEGHVVSINDTTDLRATTQELEKAYAELKEAQLQIFQQEKMASVGQLAAGVAHEINNPMGFISSNLTTLNKYIDRLAEFIGAGDQVLQACSCDAAADRLKEERKRLKIDHIMGDAHQLILESQDGAGRVRRIVQDLKNFSRVDQVAQELINLNEALETTINIAWNEIKYVATLNREFGDIPELLCFPQQLNQVFLNLLVNAGHAMEATQGSITIRTWCDTEDIFVSIADTGCGIPIEIQQRIFEPFFTTKEVGKGTGLGLSISYDIIRKHGGEMTVKSEAGRGTTFTVRLPVAGTTGVLNG
jgi:two-component system NtrC family sensor kinase